MSEQPRPFTPAQQAALKTMAQYVRGLQRSLVGLSIDLAGLQILLVKKGQIAPEELTAERAEVAATREVEIALRPGLQAIEDELRRVFGDFE